MDKHTKQLLRVVLSLFQELAFIVEFNPSIRELRNILQYNLDSDDFKWIEVTEKLPDRYKEVCIKLNTGFITTGYVEVPVGNLPGRSFHINHISTDEKYSPKVYVVAWTKLD